MYGSPGGRAERCLGPVVCFGGVSQNPESYLPDEPGIAPEKDGQRFPAALADLNDQGFVGQCGQRSHDSRGGIVKGPPSSLAAPRTYSALDVSVGDAWGI